MQTSDQEQPTETEAVGISDSQPKPAKRERSAIEFPYTDIGQATELVRVLLERGGGSAEPQQLAGWMDQSAKSGTFRARLSAARIFGFLETSRGSIEITPLGRAALDPGSQSSSFAEGFIRVPLFSAMFDKNRGFPLPPAAAIERQMLDLGVSSKQTERARQTFQKSAQLSGYVDAVNGRFVKPAVASFSANPDVTEMDADDSSDHADGGDEGSSGGSSGGGGGDGRHHHFVQGLLEELPETDGFANWEIEDQVEWLRAAASIFKLLSKKKGRITIEANQPRQASSENRNITAEDFD